MRKSKFTEAQILSILEQEKMGGSIAELCHIHKISIATFYKWRSRYNSLDAPTMSYVKEIEVENIRLKKLYAEAQLKIRLMEGILKKKYYS